MVVLLRTEHFESGFPKLFFFLAHHFFSVFLLRFHHFFIIFFSVFLLSFDDFSEGVFLRLFRSAAFLRPPPPHPPRISFGRNSHAPDRGVARLGFWGGAGAPAVPSWQCSLPGAQTGARRSKSAIHMQRTGCSLFAWKTGVCWKKISFVFTENHIFCASFFGAMHCSFFQKNKLFFRVKMKTFCLFFWSRNSRKS